LNSGTASKTLQVSQGFTYTMTPTGEVTDAKINGVPVEPAATYRIVANNFLSDGGDNFAAFKDGTNKYFGGLDIDGFAKYLPMKSPYTPVAPTRIGGTK
ncbi:MAG TPA: 5'-nucleotidase C-terminal domain-containing protein, partial [Mycobacteriales bacterium]|nr:5'-nucleotidase C-terminal domain-containing protein [Mycobacteriales bacterium]